MTSLTIGPFLCLLFLVPASADDQPISRVLINSIVGPFRSTKDTNRVLRFPQSPSKRSASSSDALACDFSDSCCWSPQSEEDTVQLIDGFMTRSKARKVFGKYDQLMPSYLFTNLKLKLLSSNCSQPAPAVMFYLNTMNRSSPYMAMAVRAQQTSFFKGLNSCPIQCENGQAEISLNLWATNYTNVFVCMKEASKEKFTNCEEIKRDDTSSPAATKALPKSSEEFQITLVAARKNSNRGLAAIDDIKVSTSDCNSESESSQAQATVNQAAAKGQQAADKLTVDVSALKNDILERGQLFRLHMEDVPFDEALNDDTSDAFREMADTIQGLVGAALNKISPVEKLQANGWDGQTVMVEQCPQLPWLVTVNEFREGSTTTYMTCTPPEGNTDTSESTESVDGVTEQANRRRRQVGRQRVGQAGSRTDNLAPKLPSLEEQLSINPNLNNPTLSSDDYSRILQNGDLFNWEVGGLEDFCQNLGQDYYERCLLKPANLCDSPFCTAYFKVCMEKDCDSNKVQAFKRSCELNTADSIRSAFCDSYEAKC